MRHSTVDLIKKHEGFRGNPYRDHLGNMTIGYGTLLPISEEEAESLLIGRLVKMEVELYQKIDFFKDLPTQIKDVLLNMAYNLGVPGLLKFKKTLAYARVGDWESMANEMLNSRWARQVGRRAIELSDIVRNFGKDKRSALQ